MTKLTNLRFIAFGLLCISNLYAQVPQVHSVDRAYAAPSQAVQISGSGFGTNAANLAVYFGGMKATINSVNDQLIEAQTPAGTTFDNISVFNTTTGYGSASPQTFFLDYNGTHGISATNLKAQVDFQSGSGTAGPEGIGPGLNDHCLCDFDGDKKLDMVGVNSNPSASLLNVTIFQNQSTPGSITASSFPNNKIGNQPVSSSTVKGTFHTRCGDLNGDGKPDLIVTENTGGSDRIFILQNISSSSSILFTGLTPITIPNRYVSRIEIADLDGDGKPDLIITDQTSSSATANLIILQNTSTLGTISFNSTSKNIAVSGLSNTDGLAVADLNGDFLPDIVTTQFNTTSTNSIVAVLKNQGNFTFSQTSLSLPSSTTSNVKLGDLDGDNLPEIIVTDFLLSYVSVFLNKSATAIQFASPQQFTTDLSPYGIDLGDLDGDGKLDIVTAPHHDNPNTGALSYMLTILNNTSTVGQLSFAAKISIPTTYLNRSVKIADIDGDGKPDITFTSVDDAVANKKGSYISIIRNAECMIPLLSPDSTMTVCSPLKLNTVQQIGFASYQWNNNGTAISSATTSSYTASASGLYSLTATNNDGGQCTSPQVNISVIGNATLGASSITKNSPVCIGGTLTMNVASIASASQYVWRGPDNYSKTSTTPATVSISNFSYDNVGIYYLDLYTKVGGTDCFVREDTVMIKSIAFPKFSLTTPSTLICSGQNTTLSLAPNSTPSVSYQWYLNGSPFSNTASSYTATASGKYSVKVNSSVYTSCSSLSDTVSISVVTSPTPTIVPSATTICAGQSITFTNNSTVDPTATAIYAWAFGDNTTSSDKNPAAHAYTSAQSYSATLTISYTGGVCSQTSSPVAITAQTAPSVTVTATSSHGSVFCEGDTIALQASSGFDSYQWSNGSSTLSSTSSLTVLTDGTYTVTANIASSVCPGTSSKVISLLPSPTVIASASPSSVTEGQTTQLTATGLTNYSWSPTASLSDPTISNPVATPPTSPVAVYTVSGTDNNGCFGKAMVSITVLGESIISKLKPYNFVSPDNNGQNDLWSVDNNMPSYPCSVTIYDAKGVKVYESKPYNNNWNGTMNGDGQPLPNGAYYYIIKCDGESQVKTGSITLVR